MIHIQKRLITGIAFDLEGTLVDLEPLHFLAHKITAESLGIVVDMNDPETFTARIPHLIGGPDNAVMRELIDLAIEEGRVDGMDETQKERIISELLAYKRNNFITLRNGLDKIEPRSGSLPFIEQALSRNIPIAIGSLTEREDAMILLEKSGLDTIFPPERIILRDDVKNVKPDPEVYTRTAERMGIDPTHQLVFEDSHNGIIAARDAGSLAIGVPTIRKPEIIERMKREGAIAIYPDWNAINLKNLSLEGNPPGKERR